MAGDVAVKLDDRTIWFKRCQSSNKLTDALSHDFEKVRHHWNHGSLPMLPSISFVFNRNMGEKVLELNKPTLSSKIPLFLVKTFQASMRMQSSAIRLGSRWHGCSHFSNYRGGSDVGSHLRSCEALHLSRGRALVDPRSHLSDPCAYFCQQCRRSSRSSQGCHFSHDLPLWQGMLYYQDEILFKQKEVILFYKITMKWRVFHFSFTRQQQYWQACWMPTRMEWRIGRG